MPQTDNQAVETEDGGEQATDEQIDVATKEMVEIIFEKWENERKAGKSGIE